MINGYKEPLSQLENPYFVTLTIPNVKGKYLKSSIEGMQKNFTKIRKNLTKTYAIKIKGIRKTECTYNEKKDDYHPHYHILLSGKYEAECLINSWLAYNPTCDKKGQHMEEANKDSLMELFKYFTKVVNKGTFYPKQMDIIFRSMKNKRVFQPIGIKKQVSEDVEEIEVQKIDFKGFQTEIWVWEQTAFDWVSCHGETLTEYEPSKEFTTYLNKIAAPT